MTVRPAPSAAADKRAVDAAVAPRPTAAAFFDLDNTLIRGASLFHLARGLAARRFLSSGEIARFACSQLTFRIRGERTEQVATTRERALSFARGHTVEEMVELCRHIYDDYLAEKIWPGTRALAELHRRRGEPVWLVTAAPTELAEIIAGRLGLDGALGTEAEAVDGTYTGRLVGEILHGQAKGTAVRELAERRGYDLSVCHAYSDSANDLPMLTLVGHPHAVNPDHRLRARAEYEGWPITDYRTGVRMLRAGLPGAALTGAATGAVAAGVALARRAKAKS
ncbi:HAD family hydrolase [Actinospica durhamensis]|uniref:HAD family hydrolase n=1 Tax=Actinospica durhamensis TaxID=1508375 RepID=UPI0027DBA5A0|nr:HAD-IB family hydrolase [Actinospica durhamensis]